MPVASASDPMGFAASRDRSNTLWRWGRPLPDNGGKRHLARMNSIKTLLCSNTRWPFILWWSRVVATATSLAKLAMLVLRLGGGRNGGSGRGGCCCSWSPFLCDALDAFLFRSLLHGLSCFSTIGPFVHVYRPIRVNGHHSTAIAVGVGDREHVASVLLQGGTTLGHGAIQEVVHVPTHGLLAVWACLPFPLGKEIGRRFWGRFWFYGLRFSVFSFSNFF